jgi:hypothetical protein
MDDGAFGGEDEAFEDLVKYVIYFHTLYRALGCKALQ